jgi:hypothetical protein
MHPNTYRKLIVELAAASGLPAIYPYREQAEVGGLMAYAPDLLDVYRRAAGYVDQILKGTKAGEMPIYLPVKFDLVVKHEGCKGNRADDPTNTFGACRRGDRIDLFAAVHESAYGTKRTSQRCSAMSVFGGKADIAI